MWETWAGGLAAQVWGATWVERSTCSVAWAETEGWATDGDAAARLRALNPASEALVAPPPFGRSQRALRVIDPRRNDAPQRVTPQACRPAHYVQRKPQTNTPLWRRLPGGSKAWEEAVQPLKRDEEAKQGLKRDKESPPPGHPSRQPQPDCGCGCVFRHSPPGCCHSPPGRCLSPPGCRHSPPGRCHSPPCRRAR
eukprot:364837-Chlamydomonas_euryale.AAC.22